MNMRPEQGPEQREMIVQKLNKEGRKETIKQNRGQRRGSHWKAEGRKKCLTLKIMKKMFPVTGFVMFIDFNSPAIQK